MKYLNNKYLHYLKEIIEVTRKPVVSVLPGHLSFFLLLSSIPIILIFGIIASTFSISFEKIANFITSSLPANTSKLIVPLFFSKASGFEIIVLVISALFLASRATKAIILSRATKAIILTANNIYEVKKNGISDFIKSVIITFLIIMLFVFIVIIPILGGKILLLIDGKPEFSFISNNILFLIEILRWPVSLIVVFFLIKFIYTLTPNKKIISKSVNKGTLFTTLSWLIITYIYSYYVTNYASYNNYYGSASNLIILMLWIFIISKIFVIGMIINYIEDKKSQPL